MKTIYRAAALAAIAIASLVACGNAGAKNDKKAEDTKKSVVELNTEQFNAKVYDMSKDDLKFLGNKPAIVDFTATWCGPCQRIAPILEELAKEYEGEIVIYKVDVDQNKPLAKSFEVSSIPAVMFIPIDGEPVMTIGSRDKAKFQEQINTILLGK
jgi:thioredoxin